MNNLITHLDDLRALCGPARERSVLKELPQLDAHATHFISLAPLVVLIGIYALQIILANNFAAFV